MRRVVTLLAIAALALLALTGVAQASEKEEKGLVIKETETGAAVPVGAEALATVTFKETACKFEMYEGTVDENGPAVEVRFPHFFERECEGGATKTRFYKATYEYLYLFGTGFIYIHYYSPSGKAKVRLANGCLYGIEVMKGLESPVPGRAIDTVEGTGTTTQKGCEKEHPFTATAKLMDVLEEPFYFGYYE